MACASAYAEAEGISVNRVSAMAVGYHYFFKRVEGGSSFNLRTYERAMRFFDRSWPRGLGWPAGVPRPNNEAA